MKRIIFIIAVICITYLQTMSVKADATEKTDESVNREYDFNGIDDYLEDEDVNFDFKTAVNDIMTGDGEKALKLILNSIKRTITDDVSNNNYIIKEIIIIAVLAALFSSFAGVIKNGQVSETGFTICYMLMVSYMISSFAALSLIASSAVGRMMDFMKALIPVYTVSIGVCSGSIVSNQYYSMTLAIITMTDIICLKLILPAINIYVVITVINNLYSEDYFSKACDLIKRMVSFSLKGLLTIITGINVVRQMYGQAGNGAGLYAAKNVVGFMSGMGGASGNMAQLLYGTGSIIRNSIGVAGLTVLIVIMAIPVIKILIFIFSYQITNAVIQPISDERITKILEGITEAAILILRTVFAVSLMFAITISIICLCN